MKISINKDPPYIPRKNQDIVNILQKYLPTKHVIKLKLSLIILFTLLSVFIGMIIAVLITKFIFHQ